MTTMIEKLESELARRHREQTRRRKVRSSARDIGPIPPVEDPERRAAAVASLRLFCEIYLPQTFVLKWSADHLRVIERIETVALDGGLIALAMPRGSGKSSLSESGGMWATLTGHRQFVAIIGSDESAAASMLDSIKTEFETNDLLLADFPEVLYPIRALDGIANRAAGQTYNGASTHLLWSDKEIVLPTIEGSAGSGAIIRVAGITGRIRGMAFKRADGRKVRPDLAIIDDPQTNESAKSVSQCQARLKVVTGAVLGLAGPGKKIAAVMPCTVIEPGDMADKILDRQKHPEWNGERTKLIYSWPTNAKLWDEYARIRADSLRAQGDIALATAFYAEHRSEMDAGAVVAWPERYGPDEISAVQNAVNLRLTDEAAFFAEYQNDPLPEISQTDEAITADLVMSRTSGLAHGSLTASANRVTAMIDVSQAVLWWGVVAWDETCDGTIVDYGAFPEQGRAYFTLRDAKHTLANLIKGAGLEAQIFGGLDLLTNLIMAKRYRTPAGAELGVERLLIDANWGESTDTVYDFALKSPHAAVILPSHGKGIGAASQPMAEWKKRQGEKLGHGWRISASRRGLRSVTYDTNSWKSFIAARLLTAPGDPGTLTIYGRDRAAHQMLADQMSSEFRVRTSGRGRTVDEWRLRPGRDNHLWDIVTGCAVAASILGMPSSPPRRATGAPTTMPAKSDRMSFAALQRAAKERKR